MHTPPRREENEPSDISDTDFGLSLFVSLPFPANCCLEAGAWRGQWRNPYEAPAGVLSNPVKEEFLFMQCAFVAYI